MQTTSHPMEGPLSTSTGNIAGLGNMRSQKSRNNRASFYLILFLTFFVCKASSCKSNSNCPEGSHEKIIIQNNSSIAINWMEEDSPDTIWTNNGAFPDENKGLISAGSIGFNSPGRAVCWENYYLKSDPHYHFIFSHDTVKAIGWKQISGTTRGLLKKVKVDLEDLKNNNFTITYP